ncbi:MAG: bifunctional 4-hydroxy-2-oxoglutarate aldolase/2-dehydro-3-deoxy-phosphogluconate aldolase [Candidatus Omnitrophica bacterium]|nr:bifunctional 4-hydroxy-2-oxoglutarate aldolase/2-dehydro-3-deoxy-phosphogluconate aldolase [Candidatus Omnitrophota bacterium]
MDIERFRQLPLMGIVRGVSAERIEALVEGAIAAGLRTLEITMNTADAAAVIRRAVAGAAGRLTVGAGTVLNLRQLADARRAGATFIVLPVLVPEVVAACARDGLPVFPGAFTPQEVYNAWQAGATMVKVFPAGVAGPGYFRELNGPFADIPLMAVGGVRAENAAEYFRCGAQAVGVGGSVFQKALSGDWAAATADIAAVVRAVASARTGH